MKINVLSAFAGVMTYVMYPGLAMAAADPYQLNLPEPQTVIAQQIYDQHTM
ncbi:cytochrome c oxidase subunit 2, partial [Nitrosospira multiformis]